MTSRGRPQFKLPLTRQQIISIHRKAVNGEERRKRNGYATGTIAQGGETSIPEVWKVFRAVSGQLTGRRWSGPQPVDLTRINKQSTLSKRVPSGGGRRFTWTKSSAVCILIPPHPPQPPFN